MPTLLRALLTWECPDPLLEPLRAIDVSVAFVPGLKTEAEMRAAIADKHALICHPWVPVTRAVVAAAPDLRVVSTVAVGYDNIDVAALVERQIPVSHTPGVVVEATADITYGLLLGIMRRILAGDRYVREGGWLRAIDTFGNDLAGKTLGIVGMGAIGMALAKRARASGMRIIYTNRRPRTDAPEATYATFEELVATADAICVLAPLSNETAKMFDAQAFAAMKRGAYFVNAARGGIVDSQALYDALQSGHLTAAAVDVLDPEPIGADHPLLGLRNFFITPHIGTATFETRGAMASLCIANVVAVLSGKPPLTPVPS